MVDRFTDMRTHEIELDCTRDLGELNLRYHSTGIGGVHPMAMPDPIVEGIKGLDFPLIRIFLQEFFFIYKDDCSFNWATLDAYMDAAHATGAKIMASICLKPHALYPVVDEDVWKPNDILKWQHVIRELVKRYSVERDYVSHWSVGNETNIGEWGGCPFRITSPDDFFEYYKLTIKPILETMPNAKVGGPSYAGTHGASEYIGRFVELCKAQSLQLDFVSYNMYSDDPVQWAGDAAKIKAAAAVYDEKIEIYVTELNIGIGNEASVEEKAYDAKRAAGLAAILLALHEGGAINGTFQYHAYDQFCDPRLFAPFYAKHRYMAEHWNDIPHRLGLFDLNGVPRPQYFVYDMLKKLAPCRVAVNVKCDTLYMIASRDKDKRVTIFTSNYAVAGAQDAILKFQSRGMPEGIYRMHVNRIDSERKWDKTKLIPVEDRVTYVHDDFHFTVFAPKNSVLFIEFNREEAQ